MTPDPGLDDILRRRKRLSRKRRRKRAGLASVLAVLAVLAVLVCVGLGSAYTFSSSCNLSSLQPVAIGQNSFVYAADNSLLGAIPAERNREPVSLSAVSPWVAKSTVAIEDRRFWSHGGVDPQGIARAVWADVQSGKVVQGGSTITQQLVRNLYISQEKTVSRKLKEVCLAIKLSHAWSKQRILAAYMNQVYYGNHAYGIEAAAQTYYSKDASRLTLGQAALLAGLPQAPSAFDPFVAPQKALARRDEVLQALLANGDITQAQYAETVADRNLRLDPGRLYTRIREPYFFSYVRDQLIAQYGANTVRSGGLRVYTTIDPRLQNAARNAITQTLNRSDDPAAAVVSINPASGAIRAMAAVTPGATGNQFNLVAQARRQAGSTFKTFVLTAAVAQGMNPSSTYYTSAPFHYQPDPFTPAWNVSTYDHSYVGPISVTSATLRSDNTVYAQLDARRRARERRRDGGQDGRADPAHARAVDRARVALGLAARHGVRVLDPRRRRDLLQADGDPQGDPPQRQRRHRRGVGRPAARTRDLRGCRLDGDAGAGAERPLRNGHCRLLRPAGRGQDRDHRRARRCVVLRLPAEPRGDGLGRVPEGRDPDGQRARDLGRWWDVPRADLAPLHGVRGGEAEATRLSAAAGVRDVHLLAARPVLARLLRLEQHDDGCDDDGTHCPRSDSDLRQGARAAAHVHRSAAGSDSGRAAAAHARRRRTRPRRLRRRRTRYSRNVPPVNRRLPLALGFAVLALVAGCAAVAWPSNSPVAAAPGGHQLGDPTWSWLYLGFAAAAFVLYVVATLLVSRRSARLAAVAALAAAIQLAPLFGPLLLSTDAWTYWSYGRIAAVHHESPYTTPPSAFPHDPSYPYVGDAWRDTTSVYGPAFTLASEPLALADGSSADAAAWTYKALAAAAMLTAALLAARLSRRPALALVLVGWNPAMALDFAGGGHNDAWMAALVVAALALAASGRRQLAGAAWATASLIKWVPLLLLPLRALEARATGRPVRHLGFAPWQPGSW